MATVVLHAVVSVDGYIADDNDDVGPLFGEGGRQPSPGRSRPPPYQPSSCKRPSSIPK
jgi:hypothetical protein